MGRIVVLVSACSVFLVAGWLLVITGGDRSNSNEKLAASVPAVRKVDLSVDKERQSAERLLPQQTDKKIKGINPAATGPVKGRKDDQDVGKRRPVKGGLKGMQKGVQPDRRNVIEDVSLEDFEAPEGKLWIPAAMVGPVNVDGSDPLHDVTVAYCQLDMQAYHEAPWLFAMGVYHQRQSGCLDDKSLVRNYRLSSLAVRNVLWSIYLTVDLSTVVFILSSCVSCSDAADRLCSHNIITWQSCFECSYREWCAFVQCGFVLYKCSICFLGRWGT